MNLWTAILHTIRNGCPGRINSPVGMGTNRTHNPAVTPPGCVFYLEVDNCPVLNHEVLFDLLKSIDD
jgi:hypothetical protein